MTTFDKGLNHWLDIVVVVLYFAFVTGVGLWTLWRPSRSSVKGYFLAGREMMWFPVGASLYASNIGSEHFIGLAGTGAASGIAIVMYEWAIQLNGSTPPPLSGKRKVKAGLGNLAKSRAAKHGQTARSMPLVMLLSWLFLPVYLSAGVYTLPEYLQLRFGGSRLRIYMSCLSLLLYIVTKIAVCIFAGALFIQMALGWDMYLSIIVLLVITGIYTVLGGLAAVIYTDAVQCVIMTLGAVALTIISFNQVGSYENMNFRYMRAVPEARDENTTCGLPREDAFHLFRDPVTGDNPWPGLILQSTIGCIWYWCCDQVIVQRVLAAKNVTHAKGAAIMAGYLKLLPIFLMIFPGMISRILFPDDVACADPDICRDVCNNPTGCSNIAYPLLVMELMPIGLRGLLMAVMLSAIMSSLTSIFNSSATVFTLDLWKKGRPHASEGELLIVGRVAVVILCVISILWIPLIQSSAGGQLFVYIQAIQGYLGTPIGALFLLAVFWPRINEQGAFWGILFGHLCGCTRMVLDFVYPEPGCSDVDTRPAIVSALHYTYFSQLNMAATAIVISVISLLTSPPDTTKMAGVTWQTRMEPPVDETTNPGELNFKPLSSVFPEQLDKETDSEVKIEKGIVPMETTNSVNSLHSAANGVSGSTGDLPPQQSAAKPLWRRVFDFVCGMPPDGASPQQKESYEERMALLREKPKWRRLVNVNAVIAIAIAMFLLGFYH